MAELSLVVVVLALSLFWASRTVNHIPKTGRDGNARGDKITATITNENKKADSVATMCAEKDGRKFKVKMKPTEAHLWIKGDDIEIVLNEDGKNYRVLFNDYFRKNEERLREAALEKLDDVSKYRIASLLVKYNKDDGDGFQKSHLDSQAIFAFSTYMRMIDFYSIISVVIAAVMFCWKSVFDSPWEMFILPVILIGVILWSVYSMMVACESLLKKAGKKYHS